jgi:hypothetical protein
MNYSEEGYRGSYLDSLLRSFRLLLKGLFPVLEIFELPGLDP